MLLQSLWVHKVLLGNRSTDRHYNTRFDYGVAQPVDSIGTTAFIIRRSTWETHGLLDERFTLAFGDLAYCLMLKRNKQQLNYVPNAVVLRYGHRTINANGYRDIRLTHQALRGFLILSLPSGTTS